MDDKGTFLIELFQEPTDEGLNGDKDAPDAYAIDERHFSCPSYTVFQDRNRGAGYSCADDDEVRYYRKAVVGQNGNRSRGLPTGKMSG